MSVPFKAPQAPNVGAFEDVGGVSTLTGMSGRVAHLDRYVVPPEAQVTSPSSKREKEEELARLRWLAGQTAAMA